MKPAAADWASRKSQSAATSPMGALARSVKRACRAGPDTSSVSASEVALQLGSVCGHRYFGEVDAQGQVVVSYLVHASQTTLGICIDRFLHLLSRGSGWPGSSWRPKCLSPPAAQCGSHGHGDGREGPSLRGRGSYAVRRLRVVAIRYAPLSHAPNACSQRNLTQRAKRQAGHLKLDKKRHGVMSPES